MKIINNLRTEFETIIQKYLIRSMLEKLRQLDDEQKIAYINDAESLCRRIDPLMSQAEILRKIIKRLKLNIARYIGMKENYNIKELKGNIKKHANL